MTLKELAERCGVSVSTVSRVVNGADLHAASPAVCDRIWRAARETGYIPNRLAQELKRQKGNRQEHAAKRLACIFARGCDEDPGPFFTELFRIVEQECMRSEVQVTGVFPAEERDAAPLYTQGIIIMGRCSRALLARLRKRSRNLMYVGLNPMADLGCDQVVCNGYEAALLAVRHLGELGHTKIAYVGEQPEEARYRGYFDAMHILRLPVRQPYVINTRQSAGGGYSGGLRLLKSPCRPTAVFCANDITALGLLRAAKELGIAVPGELSVISIDNIEQCRSSSPMLTSIHIPKDDLGRLAVKLLLDRIEGGHSAPLRVEVPFTLLRRESCAPLGIATK